MQTKIKQINYFINFLVVLLFLLNKLASIFTTYFSKDK
jgi:hypothetical protein